jgi:hypothetical protein
VAAAVGGGGEVGVVGAAAVLRLGVDRVVARAALAEVVLSGSCRRPREAVAVQLVVDDVVEVEEVGDRRFLVDVDGRAWVRSTVYSKLCVEEIGRPFGSAALLLSRSR